jgi:hypothetical protein
MRTLMCAICMCLLTLPGLCQSGSQWQVATITAVEPHPTTGGETFGVLSWDVSVRVGNTIYRVLYTPPLDTCAVKYIAGRELLVLVGKNSITYNDLLGQSHGAPIRGRTTVSSSKSK